MRVRGAVFALAVALAAGCRQDMHDQPKYKPYRASDFFGDHRSARDPMPGTVARGQLHADTYFETGKIGDAFGDTLPFPVVLQEPDPARRERLLELSRGQQRFE